jgi:riboflavin transporter FmnP
MKENFTLTIVSLLSVLFMTLHLADDIVRGMEPGTLLDLITLPIVVVQLYGALVLAGKRSGYVILLVVSLLELVVPVVHMKGAGVGAAIANSNGAFFFIWTLLALGVTALFSVILSARGLWEHLPRRTAAQRKQGAAA